MIADHNQGGSGEWVEYTLSKNEYISGIYGQMHKYFGYIVKFGLITNKEHSVFDN